MAALQLPTRGIPEEYDLNPFKIAPAIATPPVITAKKIEIEEYPVVVRLRLGSRSPVGLKTSRRTKNKDCDTSQWSTPEIINNGCHFN